MNFKASVNDASVLTLADLERLVKFDEEQLAEHRAAMVGARLGARPVKKSLSFADMAQDLLTAPTPTAPVEPTIAELGTQLTFHQDAVKRLKRDLDLRLEANELADRRARAELADMLAETDAVLASTKPPEPHEVWAKEREVRAMGAKIAKLENSRDTHDWTEAKRLYPEIHRLEEELGRMQQGFTVPAR